MTRAVLALGSNLGDRRATLTAALTGLTPWLRARSPVYETDPWGPVEQGDFLNVVVIVDDPDASAAEWWQRAQALEQAAGRVRTIRFGPRTLDVDVISVDDECSSDPVLTLPHPRAAQRAFVLVPWLAADAAAVLPGAGRVADLVAGLDPAARRGVRIHAEPAPDHPLTADRAAP